MTIAIAVEETEHVEAFNLRYVVDHILMEEDDYVMCTDLALAKSVNTLKCGPGFEPMLLAQLLSLLFNYLLVLRN